jgi:hypothetical protein
LDAGCANFIAASLADFLSGNRVIVNDLAGAYGFAKPVGPGRARGRRARRGAASPLRRSGIGIWGGKLETFYDWVTVAIFAGLVVLFLQRSTGDDDTVHDPLWMYLAASGGCAVANYLGNDGLDLSAIGVLVATLAFVVHFLKPFSGKRPG